MTLFKVEDMSCGHCVATIDATVKALDADAVVTSDLATKVVEVTSSAEPAAIQAALAEAGYEARVME